MKMIISTFMYVRMHLYTKKEKIKDEFYLIGSHRVEWNQYWQNLREKRRNIHHIHMYVHKNTPIQVYQYIYIHPHLQKNIYIWR